MNMPNESDKLRDRRLDDSLGRLPREIDPPADAWRSIRPRLTSRATRRTASRPAIALAAAAVLLLAASVFLLRAPSERPLLTAVANVDSSTGSSVLAELKAELEARRDVLSPETIAIVEHNLRTINIAIAQTSEALAEDPGNVQLERMLTQVTRQRDAFVREAKAMVREL